ncbi:MAG: 1,4-alpha-glucan branching enzyme [Proteobacteria bacterium]|nr:MAG: 1,4-alpha-glucan branching enzyme [Pseudomonadota bacterium]
MSEQTAAPPIAGDKTLLAQVLASESGDPHAVLGAHPVEVEGREGVVVRALAPDVRGLSVRVGETVTPMQVVDEAGIYAVFLAGKTLPLRYELEATGADGAVSRYHDPYRFEPTLGELDLHLMGEGSHHRMYETFGAQLREVDGVAGTSFAVWAPNAQRVSVIGDFNDWDGRVHQMRALGASGVWELFIPGVAKGAIYKYELKLRDGNLRVKTDPLAFQMELRPKSASIVHGLADYEWNDAAWMAERGKGDPRQHPMAIYEVHLGSWKRRPEDGSFYSYRELAPMLVEHCKAHGFTHLELLPIAEHAYDPSWGYQTTGYFAATSRYGTPDDLRYLIDHCHQNGLGVLLDWVPGHFPKDDYGLRWFDGTALYEHMDPREGEHRDWGTLIFNYGRNEVRAFLLSNALYWLDQFHFDGLRVDAVASMIYKDYSRTDGDWIPNEYGGRENLEAIAFLQEVNKLVYEHFPGVHTAAEESTAWPGVTLPTYLGGLGFGFKWNMGWMHDTLHYFEKDPVHRQFHHNDLTFSMLYAYSENFILPLSHDEVVHGKRSLMNKMPGDLWQQAANLRLALAYMYCHTGKKLLFMGGEFGQPAEWNADSQCEWHFLDDPRHAGVSQLHKDLGQLYLARDALWAWDTDPQGFQWIDCNDSTQSVLSFLRRGPSGHLVCVFNYTPVVRSDYRIGVPEGRPYRELINTDGAAYYGSNVGNGGEIHPESVPTHGHGFSLRLTLPPLGALILEVVPKGDAAGDATEEAEPGDAGGANPEQG